MNREELIKHFKQKTYIGDSVYIHFDGYHFVLETHNGFSDDPSNIIALEPGLIEKIVKHQKYVYEQFEELREREDDIYKKNKREQNE